MRLALLPLGRAIWVRLVATAQLATGADRRFAPAAQSQGRYAAGEMISVSRHRHFFSALLLVVPLVVLISCSNKGDRPVDNSTQSGDGSHGTNDDYKDPLPNIRGADIRLLADDGIYDPSPDISPATPLNLVINDCAGFVFFDAPDSSIDRERGTIVLNWQDHNDGPSRSLTILFRSPSCAANEGVARFLDQHKELP